MTRLRLIVSLILWVAFAGFVGGQERTPIVVSPVQEAALGARAWSEFLRSHPPSNDGSLMVRVDQIGKAVARVSDRPLLLYRFVVVQGQDLQAYSFPGGTIGLTESLARTFDRDDELAFVVAHEVAHVALRHHVFTLRLQHTTETRGSAATANLGAVVGQLGIDQELEADRYGALYAVRAGYRYTSAVEALERLRGESRNATGDAVHPEYTTRIEALLDFRSELERCLDAFDEGTAALRAGMNDDAIGSLGYFVAEFPNNVSGRVNLGSAYLTRVRRLAGTPLGLAEVLPILPDPGVVIRGMYDLIDLEEARLHYRHALDVDPGHVTALAGLALVEMRLNELELARRHLETALRIDPNDPDLLLCTGNVHYLAGNVQDARSFYLAALSQRSGWSPAVKNLALACEGLGMAPEALLLWESIADDDRFGIEAEQRIRDLTD